jgi:predicted RNase H-like HicB family nuclease
MASRISLTAVYESVDGGWIQARVAELPGVITAAPTLEEAKELLPDALREYLLALGEAEATERPPATAGVRWSGALEVVIDAA